jgi:hypothetical protein
MTRTSKNAATLASVFTAAAAVTYKAALHSLNPSVIYHPAAVALATGVLAVLAATGVTVGMRLPSNSPCRLKKNSSRHLKRRFRRLSLTPVLNQ